MTHIPDHFAQMRTHLLNATIVCSLHTGIPTCSTAAIAAYAGVSNGTLFRHFPTKQALLQAAFAHAEMLLRGPELTLTRDQLLYDVFWTLWLTAAQYATQHANAFDYWRRYRTTLVLFQWDSAPGLHLGPFAQVPHLMLEACGTTHYRGFDAWLMAAQWTAAVEFIRANYSPGQQHDPTEGPTPMTTLQRAFDGWWASFGLSREAKAFFQPREQAPLYL